MGGYATLLRATGYSVCSTGQKSQKSREPRLPGYATYLWPSKSLCSREAMAYGNRPGKRQGSSPSSRRPPLVGGIVATSIQVVGLIHTPLLMHVGREKETDRERGSAGSQPCEAKKATAAKRLLFI
jgi:hypothetical protein